MMLSEDLKNISPQQARDQKLFGPVYHGTTSDKLEKIDSTGFNVFVGHERSGEVSQGYQASDYYGGIPAPIHHLGFGVYFTTVKAIAKRFGYGNTEIGPYFLDAPRMEIINFGAPRTMMKWWLENGYDYKKSPETLFGTGQTNLSLIRQERLRATQNMTNFLKAKYDGVWFKGKSMYKLLDGDQVVIFDPSKIYRVNKDMAQSGEIGSKVVAKVGIDPYGRGEIKIPMGTKGIILDKRKPTPEQKWAAGVEWLYHIKWEKGGSMWDVLDTWVEPYTKKRKISESINSGLNLGNFEEDYKATYQQMYNELNVEKLSTQRWKLLPAKEVMRIWFTYVKYGRVDRNDILRLWYKIKDIAMRCLVASHIFNMDGPPIFKSKSNDQLASQKDERPLLKVIKFIGSEKQTFGGQDLLETIIKRAYKSNSPESLLVSIDQLLNFVHDAGDMGDVFIEGGTQTLDKINKWKPKGIHLKGKLFESIDANAHESINYKPISKIDEERVLYEICQTYKHWKVAKYIKKVNDQRGLSLGPNHKFDVVDYRANLPDGYELLFKIRRVSNRGVGYIMFDILDRKEYPWTLVIPDTISESVDEKPYYPISKEQELSAIKQIERNWNNLVGKTLHKISEERHTVEPSTNYLCDRLSYDFTALDNGQPHRLFLSSSDHGIFYRVINLRTSTIVLDWRSVDDKRFPKNITENGRPYFEITKMEELKAVDFLQKKWGTLIGKTLKKSAEMKRDEHSTYITDIIRYDAKAIDGRDVRFWLEKGEDGKLYYKAVAGKEYLTSWQTIPTGALGEPIEENINKIPYYHINKIIEQQCLHYIHQEWGDIIGKTLKKYGEERREEFKTNISHYFYDSIQYKAIDKDERPIHFNLQSASDNDIELYVVASKDADYFPAAGWDVIPHISPQKLNEGMESTENFPYFPMTKMEEQYALHVLLKTRKPFKFEKKQSLKKIEDQRHFQGPSNFTDRVGYEVTIDDNKPFTLYLEKLDDDVIYYIKSPRIIDRSEWDYVDPRKAQLKNWTSITTENLNKNSKKAKKIGDCRDENLVNQIFGNVSEFARQVELHGNNFNYKDIRIIYNPKNDIHYFYKLNTLKENDDDHWKSLEKTGFWGAQGAGAIIIARNTGRILLPKRSGQVEQPHTWGVWGGAIDSNENPLVAAKREVAEEIGYKGVDFEMVPLYVYHDNKSGFKYHNFLAIVSQEFVPKLNWETDGYKWITFGEWPHPLHFGLKALLRNDGDKIVSIIKQLNATPIRKEKVDKEKYRAAIHLIRLVWEDMRKAGAYKDRFDWDNEFVHWMLNSEPLQNLTEKYGAVFYPQAHEPGHEFQMYIEQVLESLEIKYNDRRANKINKLDPLFLLKQVVRGKTWEDAKQAIRALSTSGGKYEPRKIGDDEAETVFNRIYRIALGETFWSEEEMSHYRPLSSYILTANSPEDEIIFFRYYNKGNKFPDHVKVYRGLNSPTLTIRPGDHTSFDKGFARGYEAGKYGAVISAVLPSKDLLVKRMDVGSTELIYWPPGHKIQPIENVPTFKQFYNQWAFP